MKMIKYLQNLQSLVIIFVLFVTLSPKMASAETALYQDLSSGLAYRSLIISPTLKLHIFKANPKSIKLANIFKTNWTMQSAVEMTKNSGAIVAANSNFFDRSGQPLGLVLQNGKLIHAAKDISWWAAFLVDKSGHARIEKITSKSNLKNYVFGLQAGPRLVVDGKTLKLKSEISPKTAIGLDIHGNIYLVVSEGFIEINQLAKILASNVGLSQALNLDGGSSTQVYHQSEKLKVHVASFNRVPIGIGFFK